MRIRAGVATDIGHSRERNEDSYLAEPPVFAVADGMGGAKGGEIASAIAVEVLGDHLPADGAELVERVRDANRAVFERSVSDRDVEGMGTTLTAAIAGGGTIRLAHVGDSRAYLLRGATLRRLTEDHTLVQRMVKEGRISEEEASVHPQRNVITRVLGVDERVHVDEGALEVHDGDRILLCTDGLTGMLSEEEIQSILGSAPDPKSAAAALVKAANSAGGLDNITVIVLDVEVDEQEEASRTAATPVPTPEFAMEEPQDGGGRPSWMRWAIAAGAIALVLIVAVVGGKMYVDSQWYVGVVNGHVAVFQGIPATLAGLELHHVVDETELSAATAQQLAVWNGLADGITADSLVAARTIVDQIREDLAQQQKPPATGGGSGAGTGGGTGGGGGSGGGGSGGGGSGGGGNGGGGSGNGGGGGP